MSELIKILNDKIGYTLTVTLGFIVPGFMFVFIWNRTLFMDMDIIKLLLLSFGISFLLFIPNFVNVLFLLDLLRITTKRNANLKELIWMSVGLTVSYMSFGMIIKLFNSGYTMTRFLGEYIISEIPVMCILSIARKICKYVKKKR